VEARTEISRIPSSGASAALRRFFAHRTVWHTAGLIVALIVRWLVFRAYRQPDFIIDFMNLRLCRSGRVGSSPASAWPWWLPAC
jgi:hypothetical protein